MRKGWIVLGLTRSMTRRRVGWRKICMEILWENYDWRKIRGFVILMPTDTNFHFIFPGLDTKLKKRTTKTR